ncbi:MAG: fumarylacetoacetate hydrolase family protein [Anaerolineales bacterium]|nr:fumarylacetoacetate hydrolase family protein [Anaerolineales bacterium]
MEPYTMKFATVSTLRATTQPALVVDDRVHTLPYPDMLAVIAAGAGAASKKAAKESLAFDEVKFLSPLKPNTLRDGYAFEQHVKTANKNRGREVPEEWYQFPVFYFTNPNTAFGHDDTIPYPHYTNAMDYELEIAAIIGKGGMNIKAEDAEKHIFGYTIFNDWSARDVQRKEMVVGLGPAKGKDFASAFGPVIVTHEALADKSTGRAGVYDLEMVARVNGKELSRGNWKDMHWSFGEIIARASDSVMLNPGDVIGSGTVGTGCLLELTKFQGPWLNEGDVVELEVERIGLLRNTVGAKG